MHTLQLVCFALALCLSRRSSNVLEQSHAGRLMLIVDSQHLARRMHSSHMTLT